MSNNKKPKGFILKREYPGCNKQIGYFERYTSGQFMAYPEIWQPVYETDKIKVGDHLIEITVTKVL